MLKTKKDYKGWEMDLQQRRLSTINNLRSDVTRERKKFQELKAEYNEIKAKALELREKYRTTEKRIERLVEKLQADCEHTTVRKECVGDDYQVVEVCAVCELCLTEFQQKLAEVEVAPIPTSVEVKVAPHVEVAKIHQPECEFNSAEIKKFREALPTWLSSSWSADIPLHVMLNRLRDDMKFEGEYLKFVRLLCAGIRIKFIPDVSTVTVRQFMYKYFNQANDFLWNNANEDKVIWSIRNKLGFKSHKTGRLTVYARGLTVTQ